MDTIQKIIKASTTADPTYFEEILKHSYFDVAKAEQADLVWSIRLCILYKGDKCQKSICLYLAYPDESVGSDGGNSFINISRNESFVDAYFNNDKVKESLNLYKKERIQPTREADVINYLQLWDELFSELTSTEQLKNRFNK